MITEILCRLSSKGIDAENLTEAAHKHPKNIMMCSKPKAGIPMLGLSRLARYGHHKIHCRSIIVLIKRYSH
jgi:hypothetical protein